MKRKICDVTSDDDGSWRHETFCSFFVGTRKKVWRKLKRNQMSRFWQQL
jgi:hypothetical protein